MANSLTHIGPYPIKKCLFTLPIEFRVSAGTPTDPTTPDTEVSSDGGASYTDCTNEITTGGTNGTGYLTLTSAETDNNVIWIAAKSANCLTTLVPLYPRVLASVGAGTLSAGSAGGGTLGTLLAYDVTGCFIKTTGGTGGAAGALQVRKMVTYNTSTGAFTVVPNWETTPDNTTTYDVLLPEGVTLGMLKTLNPTTAGSTLTVTSNRALSDVDTIKTNPVVNAGTVTFPTAATLASTTNITAGTITTTTNLTNLPTIPTGWITADGIAADAIGSSELAASAVTEIQSGLSTLVAADIRTAVGLASANLDTQIGTLATAANLATVAGYLDTEIAAILADTNELQTDWANGGRLDLILDATATQTSVNTIDDFLDTEIAAIQTAVVTTIPASIALLATAANLLVVSDGVGYLTSVLLGTISDAGTAGETYVITFGGSTYTLDFTGLDSTGNRTGVTRTKT